MKTKEEIIKDQESIGNIQIDESEWNTIQGNGMVEVEISESESLFFKPKEELEYLDGDGNWRKEYSCGMAEYKLCFKKLRYNFNGCYNYFVSKTTEGYEVIWRKKR